MLALFRKNIKEKDSQVTKSGNMKFSGNDAYLFDTYDNYSGKTGYAERFPSIGEGDYRPAYACVESNTKLEIKAEPYKNITFKNERGVPVLCKDGILEVTARGDRDTTSIYAYNAENHIVGKVNVLSYDKVTRKICLVPIGDTKAPDASTVKQGLDEIFAKLMVDFDVTIGEPITIQYAKGSVFTHGGSGVIGVYNTDQKAAISKLKERGIDNETVYLFFVKECNALKANDSPDVVNGYMPRGYQFGFIYKELSNFRTIAHEICHGAFHLKHTFAQDDFLAAERSTDNLMDYNDGKTLNHWQWKDIHQPKSVRFKWLQDEEGAEYNVNVVFDDDDENYIGSDAILNLLLKHKDDILSLVSEYKEQIDKELATEIIERFFYGIGINVIIKNADEAYYYILQILVADLQSDSSSIGKINFDASKSDIIQEMQRFYRWFRNVALFHDDFIDIAKAYITVNKAIENVNDDELEILLKSLLSSSNNIELKMSVLGDMTNSQFKKILRQNGNFSNKEISELLKIKHTNTTELSKNAKVYDAILKSKASAFEPYIENANRLSLMKYAADCNPNIASEKYLKILDNLSQIGIYFDIACASQIIAEGKVAPKDLVALLPHLTGGAILIELMSERVWPEEENYTLLTTYKDIINDESGNFYLQYTNQLQKLNYHVVPTSFVFKNIEEIEGLFTITPQYLNYSNGEWSGQIKIGK